MKTWGKRILVMIGLMVMVLLVTDFNSRMAELTRLQAQETQEIQRRQNLFATQNVLETQIGYANSDAAVESWRESRPAVPWMVISRWCRWRIRTTCRRWKKCQKCCQRSIRMGKLDVMVIWRQSK